MNFLARGFKKSITLHRSITVTTLHLRAVINMFVVRSSRNCYDVETLICSFMQSDTNTSNSSLAEANGRSSTLKHNASLALERQGGTLKPYQSMRLKKRLSMHSRPSAHSKINFGDANDDVHLCILCLRAIMNHQVRPEYFSSIKILCACL